VKVDILSEQPSQQALAAYLSADEPGNDALKMRHELQSDTSAGLHGGSVGGSPPRLTQLNYHQLTCQLSANRDSLMNARSCLLRRRAY